MTSYLCGGDLPNYAPIISFDFIQLSQDMTFIEFLFYLEILILVRNDDLILPPIRIAFIMTIIQKLSCLVRRQLTQIYYLLLFFHLKTPFIGLSFNCRRLLQFKILKDFLFRIVIHIIVIFLNFLQQLNLIVIIDGIIIRVLRLLMIFLLLSCLQIFYS